ncbi:MAG: zinc-ribbon and DUF3426 domain-containing protein [Telluria sp.]
MALATQCPHCKTIFRVAQDQLKLRGGIVRCGACHEIFDGNASLVGLDAAPAAPAEAPPAAPSSADEPTVPPPAVAVADASDDVPVYALDLGAALDPLGILPKPEADDEDEHDASAPAQLDDDAQPLAAAAAGEPAAFEETEAGPAAEEPHAVPLAHEGSEEPASSETGPEPVIAPHDGRVEPILDRTGEELVATAPDEEHGHDSAGAATAASFAHSTVEHTPLPRRESLDGAGFAAPPPPPPKSARARQQARRSKLTPTRIDAPKLRVPEIDEPEFVKRGRQRELSGKRRLILMVVGSVVLLLVLAVQAAVIFRNDLAGRMPGTRPALAAMCSLLHCRVELPARIDNLTIETGELQTLGPDTYVLATLLHNQGGSTQAWPDIELALTDATDKPLVRRVFAPADYLPKGAAAAGFAAHGEQAVKLYFQLDQIKPSGYHIAVFYP